MTGQAKKLPPKSENPFASRLAVIKQVKTEAPKTDAKTADAGKPTERSKQAQGDSKGLKSLVGGRGSNAAPWLVSYMKKQEKKPDTVEGPYGLRLSVPPSLQGPASTKFVVDKIQTVGPNKADKYLASPSGRIHGTHKTKPPSMRMVAQQGKPSRAARVQTNNAAPKVPTPQSFQKTR